MDQPRIILYTGKGGVGKTSVAAASALRCAELGQRTIVLSTDPAHSLADSFDLLLGPEPTPVMENLVGQEIDIYHQMERYWGKVQEWLSGLLAWRGVDNLIADEASILPGMEEIASLLQIVHLRESGDYDTIIVDCAPTGETLRLLSLPEMARWYLTRIFPVERRAAALAGPLLRSVTDLPIPDDEVFEAIKDLILQLDAMHNLLADSSCSTMRLVMNAEKMVIKEAQRTYTYLNLYGFVTDAAICNRLMPTSTETYFAGWREAQERYLDLIHQGFDPMPILTIPFFEQEVVGVDMLRRMAETLYGEDDPARIMFKGRAHTVQKINGCYELKLPLPFVTRERIQLTRSGDELIIRIGNQKRNLVLPHALAALDVGEARYEGDRLAVTFICNDGE
ncbi:MAG: TRC40/GET3/ArsA family transport-energizing ATPase [Anaerolineae bacterium]|jgi:arsenite-transporting ATPase